MISRLCVFACLWVTGVAWGQLIPVNIQPTDKISSLDIVLTRFGPSPASVTLPSNAISLVVQNYSGLANETFTLRRASGSAAAELSASLLDLHSTNTQHRDYRSIQLTPGDYVMTFLAHPTWRVSITVTTAVQK